MFGLSGRLFSAGRSLLAAETRQGVLLGLGDKNGGCDLLRSLPSIQLTDIRLNHSKNRDLRVDYKWKRERPYGPHKHKPPNLIDPRASREIDYRRVIHYPENGEYTIRKLSMTKLGGRHPGTGRKVIEGVGGGSKRKWRWIDWHRLPQDWPRDGSVLEERVCSIHYDPNRDAKIALTGYGEKLRWQIATNKIKQGDIIRTFTEIPANPIRPTEGDSHPLGALPVGTTVCQVEAWPGEGAYFMIKAEDEAKIIRKVDDRVVIKCWDKLEFAIPQEAQCVVGTNSIHPLRAMDIGSPNRMRWLGIRPRSGLWKRKDGRRGRKIKKPPPAIYTTPYAEFMKDVSDNMTASARPVKGRSILLNAKSEGTRGKTPPYKRQTPEGW